MIGRDAELAAGVITREAHVLRLVIEGLPSKEIAARPGPAWPPTTRAKAGNPGTRP